MEIDPVMTEETAQASSGAQSSPPKTAAARSYECIYCKRGFSNAQALGGHMNIHRKDRQAKLKHPVKQTHQFPFNISAKVCPPFSPSLMGYAPKPQQLSQLCVEGPGQGDDHQGSSSLGPVVAVEELDLELRLGPERPDHASSVGLRQFL